MRLFFYLIAKRFSAIGHLCFPNRGISLWRIIIIVNSGSFSVKSSACMLICAFESNKKDIQSASMVIFSCNGNSRSPNKVRNDQEILNSWKCSAVLAFDPVCHFSGCNKSEFVPERGKSTLLQGFQLYPKTPRQAGKVRWKVKSRLGAPKRLF